MGMKSQCSSLVSFSRTALVLMLPLGYAATAAAQYSGEMTEVYGRGVHSYFAGQIAEAEQQFTQVIDAGSTDPRVYYFRAIARMRSGQPQAAAQDLRLGAAYEARDPGAASQIGTSL